MRTLRIVLALAALFCTGTYAHSIDAAGTGLGNVVLYFSGTSATGTFTSTLSLTGQLTLDGAQIAFSASGWAHGSGRGDTATLDMDAQATFATSGATETGESISIQGGLTLAGVTAGTTGSSGSGTGTFFATIFLGNEMYRVQGDAEGSATGAFVIPEDPYSMELAGDALFHLSGEATAVLPESSAGSPLEESSASIRELLPWDESMWREGLLAELLDILTRVIETAIEEPATSE